MLLKIDPESCSGTVHCSPILSVCIIGQAIGLLAQASQLNIAFPLCSVKSVIHLFSLANSMGFGSVKTDVVKVSKVFASGKHLVLVEFNPMIPDLLLLRSEIQFLILA